MANSFSMTRSTIIIMISLGCLGSLQALNGSATAAMVTNASDPLADLLDEYSTQSEVQQIHAQPEEVRQAFYSAWLDRLLASREEHLSSPEQRNAIITTCSLRNALGIFSEAEHDCVLLAASAVSATEQVRWNTEAAEFAWRQRAVGTRPGPLGQAETRADQYLVAAMAVVPGASEEGTLKFLSARLRALRFSARLKDSAMGQPIEALRLLREGRALAAAGPATLREQQDRSFAGVEMFSSAEADLCIRLGRLDEALQAIEFMIAVIQPKQPMSFYAARAASQASIAGLRAKSTILSDYLANHVADPFTPACKYELAVALVLENRPADGIAVLRLVLADGAAGLTSIDDRLRQSGSLGVGMPGWVESAKFVLGQALANESDPECVPYLREFALSFPTDDRAQVAHSLLRQFGQ